MIILLGNSYIDYIGQDFYYRRGMYPKLYKVYAFLLYIILLISSLLLMISDSNTVILQAINICLLFLITFPGVIIFIANIDKLNELTVLDNMYRVIISVWAIPMLYYSPAAHYYYRHILAYCIISLSSGLFCSVLCHPDPI